jgi:anti-sigma regulatory factor (Ser/Thr protein kinase)
METSSFKSEVESIHAIQEFVKTRVSRINTDESKRLKIDLLIEELIINIVKHGYKGIDNGTIEVMINDSGKDFILQISDNGNEFNPLDQKNPDISAGIEDRRPGGLGIFLIKQIAKDIEYVRQDNNNIIRLLVDI